MIKNHKRYTVKFRRKREGKTNYKKRLNLLKSKKIRAVIRRGSKHTLVQFVEFHPKGDKVLLTIHSNKLKKMGWLYNGSNMSSTYLTALLAGLEAQKKGIKECIYDIGLYSPVSKSKIFAGLKGLVDSGLNINHSSDVLPDDEVVSGKRIKDYALLLKSDKEKYEKQFSQYLKSKLNPENICDDFKKIKDKMIKNG